MKKYTQCVVFAVFCMAARAHAATLYLAADDGGGSITLAPGELGNINIMLDTDAADSASIQFINLYFDEVGAKCHLVSGSPPIMLDTDCDGPDDPVDEYGLVYGGPALPPGEATYILDTVTIIQDADDSLTTLVYFEDGARKPLAFGPPPDYTPFTTNDFLCAEITGFLNLGVGNYTAGCADGFEIHKIPEPGTLGLSAVGGLAALRRRR